MHIMKASTSSNDILLIVTVSVFGSTGWSHSNCVSDYGEEILSLAAQCLPGLTRNHAFNFEEELKVTEQLSHTKVVSALSQNTTC